MRIVILRVTGTQPAALCSSGVGSPWHYVQYWLRSFAPADWESGSCAASAPGGIWLPIIGPSIMGPHLPSMRPPHRPPHMPCATVAMQTPGRRSPIRQPQGLQQIQSFSTYVLPSQS